MKSWIVRIPEIQGGQPTIAGTRITVAAIKGRVSRGEKFSALIEDYPYVPLEAFIEASQYEENKP